MTTTNAKTEFAGYLTRDAEARKSTKGTPYILMSVAVVKKETDTTTYVRTLSFDRSAVATDFIKGATVKVIGKLSHDKYVGRDGEEKQGKVHLALFFAASSAS